MDRLKQGTADFYLGTGQVAADISDKLGIGDIDLQNMRYISPEEVKNRKQQFQDAAKLLKEQEGDVGFGGGLVQALGNPTTYAAGPLKLAAPVSAFLQTLFRSESEDKGLGDRATDAAINAGVARVAAPLVDGGIRKVGEVVKSGASAALHPIDTVKRITSPIAAKALDMDNPVTGAEGLKRAMGSAYAKEGARLEQKLGTTLTTAEKTGNQRAVAIEDYLANSPATSEQVFANARTRIDDLTDQFEQKLFGVSPRSSSAATIGSDVSRSYDDIIARIRDARRVQADFDFGKANRLARGAPVITPNNTIATLQKFITEANSELATPAQREAGRQAEAMLRRLTQTQEKVVDLRYSTKVLDGTPIDSLKPANIQGRPEVVNAPVPKPLTIRDLQNGLSTYTEAGKTTGGIWKDIGTAQDRRFANEMKSALMKDMDESIAQVGDDTIRPALDALSVARDRYKDFSGRLEKVRGTVLGKYLGTTEARSPERVAEQLRAMRPTEIEATLKVLDRASPEVAMATRRYYLESAISAATSGKGQAQTGLRTEGSLDVKQLLKSLPSDEQMNAIFRSKAQLASVREDLTDVVSALNRIVTYGGTKGGSPTATRAETGAMLRAPIQFLKRMAYDAALPSNIAEIMLNPTQRKAAAKAARAGDHGTLAKLIGNVAARTTVPAVAHARNDEQDAEPGGEVPGSAESRRERGVGGASTSPAIQPGRSILPSPQSNASPLVQRMAQAESGGDPNAKSPKGSASGLLQFTDDTWARSVARWGKELGVTLPDKNKPEAQIAMAERLAADNARILGKQIGRPATEGEIYAAHFLGAPDAAKLIKAQGTGKQAIVLFPRRVVNDNRTVFFDKGRPRTVEEVYALLNSKVA